MTLNQIAQQAMDYLDSVGVAADYKIMSNTISVTTDEHTFLEDKSTAYKWLIKNIMRIYPQKSPA